MAATQDTDPFPGLPYRFEIDGVAVAAFQQISFEGSPLQMGEAREEAGSAGTRDIALERGFSVRARFELLERWLDEVSASGEPERNRRISILVRDEAGKYLQRIVLGGALPVTLVPVEFGAGVDQVMIDTFVLSAEGIMRLAG